DYDSDPARFAANPAATARFSAVGDVHVLVAERLASIAAAPVLDLGGGNGTLAHLLADRRIRTIVLDQAVYIDQAPRPVVRADAHRLPFIDRSFGAVAALWMLYHLHDPYAALIEAARVLRAGGNFVACTSSRFNDPEIASALPDWGQPFSFDAESAPVLVAEVFEVVDVQQWDTPMVTLPDRAAVELFLRGRGLPRRRAEHFASEFLTPLDVTKRGMLIWAIRR
ncbi:MAG: class I SAM-dependent methyltransferase, partial [Solirubrobacteraceae bacterium]